MLLLMLLKSLLMRVGESHEGENSCPGCQVLYKGQGGEGWRGFLSLQETVVDVWAKEPTTCPTIRDANTLGCSRWQVLGPAATQTSLMLGLQQLLYETATVGSILKCVLVLHSCISLSLHTLYISVLLML